MNDNKKNTISAVTTISLIFVRGCGLFNGHEIENAVINSDLEKQELSVTEGASKTWNFGRDQGRCFDIISSDYSGDTAHFHRFWQGP